LRSAGGSIATESVVRPSPDGYTLLITANNDAWNTVLYDNLKFHYLRSVVGTCRALARCPALSTRSK
jgi:hypothetical protein